MLFAYWAGIPFQLSEHLGDGNPVLNSYNIVITESEDVLNSCNSFYFAYLDVLCANFFSGISSSDDFLYFCCFIQKQSFKII